VAIAIVLSNFTLISGYFILELENWFNGAFTSIRSALEKKLILINFFYWDFLGRHHNPLKSQNRRGLILTNFIRISSEELQKIHQGAMGWYAKIDSTV